MEINTNKIAISSSDIDKLISKYRELETEPHFLVSTHDIDLFLRDCDRLKKNKISLLISNFDKNSFASDFDPINIRGDTLHLSDTYREEHVTNWLKWILSPPFLSNEQKSTIFSSLFSKAFSEVLSKLNLGSFKEIQTEIQFESEFKFQDDQKEQRSLDMVVFLILPLLYLK